MKKDNHKPILSHKANDHLQHIKKEIIILNKGIYNKII